MDIFRLIANDQANIIDLGRAILRGLDGGVVRSRDRLFDELDGEIRRYLKAVEDSLYDALEDHERTRRLVEELEGGQEEIERQLAELGRVRNKNTREWTDRFEDFTYLLDQQFHRETHELLPAARELLSPDEVQELRHEYAEEKIEALRAEHRAWGLGRTGLVLGALAGAAAGALAFAAWRSGYLRALGAPPPDRRFLSFYAKVKQRSRENRARRERDPLLR